MPTQRYGQAQLANGDGTSQSADILVGAATGTKVREIRVYSGPTTAPGSGVLVIQVYNGSNSRVIAKVALNNTADAEQEVFTFRNLILPSGTHTIRAQMRTAITSGGTVDITVYGTDL
jgi:hypothetical protein